LFGRRKRDDVARAEEAREAERRALFEQLAKRPETVCPFLGLADDRAGYQPEPNAEHRCYAFGDPAPLSDEQQRHVCLERGYSNCPRYLRGVLVIPTEELEALRRPQPHVAPPPPPPPRPVAQRRRRRSLLVLLPLLILLVAAVGIGGLYLVNPKIVTSLFPISSATPTTVPTASAGQSGTPRPTGSASFLATATPTPLITPTPLPTPAPGDTFIGYQVGVGPQAYQLFQVDEAGNITKTRSVLFSRFSHASVVPEPGPNGLRSWRTTDGDLAGWAYIKDRSGSFEIRKLYRAADGSQRAIVLPPDQV
jgi:hypothetical protein